MVPSKVIYQLNVKLLNSVEIEHDIKKNTTERDSIDSNYHNVNCCGFRILLLLFFNILDKCVVCIMYVCDSCCLVTSWQN